MDPYVTGSLISAGASLLGGSRRKSTGVRRRDLKKQYHAQRDFQPETERAIMAGRLANAEEFGIHPLVAMGIDPAAGGGFAGQVGMMDENPIGDVISQLGRDIGQGYANKKANDLANQETQARIDLLKAQANDLGQKPPQVGVQDMPGVTVPPGVDPEDKESRKAIAFPLKVEPNTVTAPISPGNPGQRAGSEPGWGYKDLSLGGFDLKLNIPFDDVQELLSIESILWWPAIYAANDEAIHKWVGQLIDRKSNIGKLGAFGKFIYNMVKEKL